jgi:general stress protein 26
MADPVPVDELLRVAHAIIEENRYCFMITLSKAGQLNARLMQHLLPTADDLIVRLGTSVLSRKVNQILSDNRVALAYQTIAGGPAYVTLSGTARLITGEERRRHWHEEWRPYFPDGPDSDEYTVIEVTPNRIEIMDYEQDIAPNPYGLLPAVLVRQHGKWVVETNVSLS